MKREFSFDQSSFRILYNRYKDYLIPFGVLLVSIFILLFVVIPQVQDIITEKAQEADYRSKIQTIENNLQLIESLNPRDLDSQAQLVSSTLPPDKDFVSILNAISLSSAKAGVSLGDFSFQVGSLATRSAENITSLPGIPVKLIVTGKLKNIEDLLHNLEQSVPISDSDSIEIGGQSASFTQRFHYRFEDQVSFDPNLLIQPLSEDDLKLINAIKSWGNQPSQNSSGLMSQESLPASSTSAFFSP